MDKIVLKQAIIEVFGQYLNSGIDYLEIDPNDDIDFESDLSGLNSLHSELFYQAVSGGGYEVQFSGKLASILHYKKNQENSNLFVLRERTYNANGLVNENGAEVSKKTLDIVCLDINNNSKVAGIEIGQRRLFENLDFLSKIDNELENIPKIGFKQKYFIALVTDVDLNGERASEKFSNHFKDYKKRTSVVANEKINSVRKKIKGVDKDFNHLIFKSNSISGYNSTTYINVFVLEKN